MCIKVFQSRCTRRVDVYESASTSCLLHLFLRNRKIQTIGGPNAQCWTKNTISIVIWRSLRNWIACFLIHPILQYKNCFIFKKNTCVSDSCTINGFMMLRVFPSSLLLHILLQLFSTQPCQGIHLRTWTLPYILARNIFPISGKYSPYARVLSYSCTYI